MRGKIRYTDEPMGKVKVISDFLPSPEELALKDETPIMEPKGVIAMKFEGSEKRCIGLAAELENVAKECSVSFFNAGAVTGASTVDGIHLDENQHQLLGEAIARAVSESKAF